MQQASLLRPMQRFTECCLRQIVSLGRSVAGLTLCREAGVVPIAAYAAGQRYRAFRKFPSLKTWISVLIGSSSQTTGVDLGFEVQQVPC